MECHLAPIHKWPSGVSFSIPQMPPGLYSHLCLEYLAFIFLDIALRASAQWTATPFNAPSIPVAVRSPYLNTWFQQGENPLPTSQLWSTMWQSSVQTGNITATYTMVKVDGQTCQITGNAGFSLWIPANQTDVELTPTRSSLVYQCFQMDVNLTFLNPISPNDLTRQSLPYSYIYMSASSRDGKVHSVSMYSDISGEWLSGDISKIMTWNTNGVDGNYTILSAQLQDPQPFGEIADHAEDATEYFAMKNNLPGATISWQLSGHIETRAAFENATLSNSADPASTFRAIDNDYPVLGIAVDFGIVATTPQVVWSHALIRDPVVQYMNSAGNIEMRRPYFMSAFSDQLTAARFVVDDFANALEASVKLDARITADARSVSPLYADLLSISTLQSFGGIEITLGQNVDGSWNNTDIKAFMKNMGDVGASSGVNAVDVIYAAFPAYIYANPELIGYLLQPLLEFQTSPQYTLPYAALNIGSSYPNATGDGVNRQHDLGVEESANMLIMTLAHAQTSNNRTLIGQYYTLLRNWADYVVENALTPSNQLSPDMATISNNNQTNIALKGIIGIAAMGKISAYAGSDVDEKKYSDIAQELIQQWVQLATAADGSHILMTYGQQSTSGLIYNLYADKLLQLDLVPQSVYDVQTSFLQGQAAQSHFGIPLDNSVSDSHSSRTDWMMFSAASVTNNSTRDTIIQQVHAVAASNQSNVPFCAAYDPLNASCRFGQNSPAQGGVFALLALNTLAAVNSPTGNGPAQSVTVPGHSKVNAIVGGAISGVVFLILVIALVLFAKASCLVKLRSIFSRESKGTSPHPRHLGSIDPFESPENWTPSTTPTYNNELKNRLPLVLDLKAPLPPLSIDETRGSQPTEEQQVPDTIGLNDSPRVGSSEIFRQELVMELRGEVDNLRRELEQTRLQVERVRADQAPPGYEDGV